MAQQNSTTLVQLERITRSILVLRGQRVILDRDFSFNDAATTERLNEQVKRNAERFPEDFMFQLTAEEAQLSRSQIATLNGGRGHNIKYLPHAFTEHGAIQAANVLNSPRAVAMGVYAPLVSVVVEVRRMAKLGRSTIYRLQADRKFPQSFRPGAQVSDGWSAKCAGGLRTG